MSRALTLFIALVFSTNAKADIYCTWQQHVTINDGRSGLYKWVTNIARIDRNTDRLRIEFYDYLKNLPITPKPNSIREFNCEVDGISAYDKPLAERRLREFSGQPGQERAIALVAGTVGTDLQD